MKKTDDFTQCFTLFGAQIVRDICQMLAALTILYIFAWSLLLAIRGIEHFNFLLEQRGLFLLASKLIVEYTFAYFFDLVIQLLLSQQLCLFWILIFCPTLFRLYLYRKNSLKST